MRQRVPQGASRKESLVKRLVLILVILTAGAAGCGGVKTGSADADGGAMDGDHRADAGPTDPVHRIDGGGGTDDGGTDGDQADAGATDDTCVLGTSQLGNCSL